MRIAVVGAGVAGLGSAYLLSRAHHIDLFERDRRAGCCLIRSLGARSRAAARAGLGIDQADEVGPSYAFSLSRREAASLTGSLGDAQLVFGRAGAR